VKNLHLAAKETSIHNSACDYQEPLYDVQELRSIAPADTKQSFDIRSIIARIVDGSEFDEFKKLYGTVRISLMLDCPLHSVLCVVQLKSVSFCIYTDTSDWFCKDMRAASWNYWKQWHFIYRVGTKGYPLH
jgi:hypothetical protein